MTTKYELIEVPNHELGQLRDSLQKNIPDSVTVYGFVDVHLRYGPFTKIKLKFYSAKDEQFQSFCCITSETIKESVPSLSAFWNPDEIKDKDVGQLFFNIPNWNWNLPFVLLVSSYQLKLRFDSLIERKLLQSTLELAKDFNKEICEGILVSLSKEDYKNIKIPFGYTLNRLPVTWANTMLSKWDFRYCDTVEALEERLSVIGGFGSCRTNSSHCGHDIADSPVSWIHQYMNGILGMTYTEYEERRKGHAASVTLALAKKILDQGGTPYIMIGVSNSNALKLHEKLGFRIIGSAGLSVYIPVGTSVKDISVK